ncbi:hypothetical protein AYI68_g3217 [Smittium mucronatum]|uniref:Uncharacterized protein n=1 Tax=Smittium mucronatum TaxID=133383 RepID=A0A1R0H0J3_9FUNG|nr:hypothetical protein AYI68_g3217 [Smittium mucronatum]
MNALVNELKVLNNKYKKIIKRWPVDKLRPNHCISLSLKEYAQDQLVYTPDMKEAELEQRILTGTKQAAALDRILSNEAFKKYPLSHNYTHSPYEPDYYARLMKHIDDVSSGKAKPPGNWLMRFLTK